MSNWLNLQKLKTWPHTTWTGFCYDYITNEDIEQAFKDPYLILKLVLN